MIVVLSSRSVREEFKMCQVHYICTKLYLTSQVGKQW